MRRQNNTKSSGISMEPFHIETGKPLYEMEEEDYSDVTCKLSQ